MQFWKKLTQKGFRVELEDPYRYPQYKGFKMANNLVMQAALENYCMENGLTIEYIRKEKPISFILNGKEKYSAKLEMGYGRTSQGYYIHCLEIMD